MVLRHIKTRKQFETLLQEEEETLIVVFFGARWCNNCSSIKPFFHMRSDQFRDVIFVEVDVDESEDLSRAAGITCMPTFHFYSCQAKVAEFTGTKRDKLDHLLMRLK
ncbi:thioredoxin-like [Scyliorhinus canicula]|uniref:thioredoxin-like n=1 Tax=Scyliorhinus canicula TaxID=7830 RepID=UPI0018F44D48|nr:thioredoxin-like [Scyliorhinus canicula]